MVGRLWEGVLGLGIHVIEPLIREHRYRPVSGDVVTIGRQTVYHSPEEILEILTQQGIDTSVLDLNNIEIDNSTVDRLPGFEEKKFISDRSLFKLLGATTIRALDRSDYEEAEIIHDLSLPLPSNLHAIADFIVDGSTLDNTFDPACTLKNYCDLLKPYGRILMLNAFSCYGTPYCIMPPNWYLDYFIANGFLDCKAYVLAFGQSERDKVEGWNSYWLDIDWLQKERRRMGRFVSNCIMACVIFAEKGANSTTNFYPIQQDYRSAEDWEFFSHHLAVMQKSSRPHLLRSNIPAFVPDVLGGHMLIDSEFNAVAPIAAPIVAPIVKPPEKRVGPLAGLVSRRR